MSPKVYCVDVDGTLTTDTCWTNGECLNATANQEMIAKVNGLYEKNFIIIHTARRHSLYQATINWLNWNDVKYHAVSFEKTPGIPVDLDAINEI